MSHQSILFESPERPASHSLSVIAQAAGYASYADYLNSRWWKNLCLRLKAAACWCCGQNQRLCLHHLTYERLGSENDADLVTVCSLCHKEIHILNRNGTPLTESHLVRHAHCIEHPIKPSSAGIIAGLTVAVRTAPLTLEELCRQLQRASGTEPFFLAARTAARLLGVSHPTASRRIKALLASGFLEIPLGMRGSYRSGKATYYRVV